MIGGCEFDVTGQRMRPLKNTYSYNRMDRTWHTEEDMPHARSSFLLFTSGRRFFFVIKKIFLGRKIYVKSGEDESNEELQINTIDCFDTLDRKWTTVINN